METQLILEIFKQLVNQYYYFDELNQFNLKYHLTNLIKLVSFKFVPIIPIRKVKSNPHLSNTLQAKMLIHIINNLINNHSFGFHFRDTNIIIHNHFGIRVNNKKDGNHKVKHSH